MLLVGGSVEPSRRSRPAVDRDEEPRGCQVLGRAQLRSGTRRRIDSFERCSLEPPHGYALNNLGFAYLGPAAM